MDLITLALAKKYANKKFESAIGFQGFKVVDVLPTTDISTASIYLLRIPQGESGNRYDEYVYAEGDWESLGSTVDLEGYVTEEALNEALKNISWNDLKDKPFYSTSTPGESIYSGECYFTNQSPSGTSQLNFFYAHQSYMGQELEGNYYVTIDGKTVFCTSAYDSNLVTVISNGMAGGWTLKDPDGIVIAAVQRQISTSGSNQYDWIFYYDKLGTYSVKVEKEVIEYKYLDSNFLSETIARIEDVESLEAKHDEDIANANEAHTALEEKIEDLSWDSFGIAGLGQGAVIFEGIDIQIQGSYAYGPAVLEMPVLGNWYYLSYGGTPKRQQCTTGYMWGEECLQIYPVLISSSGSTAIEGNHGEVYNITIWKEEETINYLDEKYIPDTIARTSDIPTVEELVAAVIAALPAAEEVEI